GQDSRIVLCDWGSQIPGNGRTTAENLFRSRHGCRDICVLGEGSAGRPEDELRAIANAPSSMAILDECDVFFFTGGDQRILLAALRNTKFERRLTELWRLGKIVIAGTSAGLQIQSELALTGDFSQPEPEAITVDETRCTRIARHNVGVTPGFGLLQNVILDQHFVKRQRHNRLISVVLDYPSHLGIGVDEGTALIFNGRSGEYVSPRVVGESCVFYVNARQADMQIEPQGQLRLVENLNCGLVWEGAVWPFPILLA
ncbi:MAG: cyanophycinase, partial [Pseudobdellovibrionaceae bacterium]|nr:cyanophycinase [Pseudobdellovibrionaceae bacterium]